MENEINVIMPNYNSADFVIATLEALQKTTLRPWRAYIRDNGSRTSDRMKLAIYETLRPNVKVFYHPQTTFGSMNHGESINYLFRYLNTKYSLILDADFIITLKDWDKELIDIMYSGGYSLVGSHLSVPRTHMLFFHTSFLRWKEIDWRPKGGLDIGWQLTKKALPECMLNLPQIPTRTNKGGPFRNTICGEYYLPDGTFFGSHFGRGSNPRAAKYTKGIPFWEKILKYRRFKQDKQRWLSTAEEVVNAQLS